MTGASQETLDQLHRVADLAELPTDALWEQLRDEGRYTERQRKDALEALWLQDDKDPAVAKYILEELGREDVPSSWTDHMLAASVPAEFYDHEDRELLAERLLKHAHQILEEANPERIPFVTTALHRYSTVAAQSSCQDFVPFLAEDNTRQVVRAAARGIVTMFSVQPAPKGAIDFSEIHQKLSLAFEKYSTQQVGIEDAEYRVGMLQIFVAAVVVDHPRVDHFMQTTLERSHSGFGDWSARFIERHVEWDACEDEVHAEEKARLARVLESLRAKDAKGADEVNREA